MSKKDYELVASVIYSLYLGHENWNRNGQQVASKFAEKLAERNPKFNRSKFFEACGLEA